PDLILLDIKMPEMDGYEVCQQLKANEKTRHIPVIFISALAEVADKVKGFTVGGVDYITKPFRVEEILARVKTHLTLYKLQNELEQRVEERTAELAQANANLKAKIIEHQRAEESLRESEERYHSLFENANDAIYLIKPQTTRILDCNKMAVEMSGYSIEELKKMTTMNLHPEDELDVLPGKFKEVSDRGSVAAISNLHHVRKDGRLVPIEVNATMIEVGGEELNLSIVRDVTERVRAEKVLRESEHYLKEAQAMAHLGHWQLSPETGEISGSDELFRIFDLPREEATLEAFVEVVHPDDKEYDLYHIGRGIEYGEPWDIEHRLICQDG
ncbi:MAG: PAS domain S-box protein, partial [Proteobacteria bacterium]|nr:PAS domain S-box protein [Pseudomonadota bacterium]